MKDIKSLISVDDRSGVELWAQNSSNDINLRLDFYNTPLAYAVKCEKKDIVLILLKNKAEVNVLNNMRESPLIMAVKRRRYDIAVDLIKAGADVNFPYEKQTILPISDCPGFFLQKIHEKDNALNLSVANCSTTFLLKLIKNGADVNALNSKGMNPLQIALINKNYDVANLLLENDANPNFSTYTVGSTLHCAIEGAGFGLISKLVEKNAAIDVIDKMDHTPLSLAAACGRDDVVLFLLKKGANVTFAFDKGASIYFAAMCCSTSTVLKIIKKGAIVDVEFKDLGTPLSACANMNLYCKGNHNFNELLRKGASLGGVMSKNGNYLNDPISKKCCQFFFSSRYDEKEKFLTPSQIKELIFWAVSDALNDYVFYCLNQGADVNYVYKDEKTLLYIASENGHCETVSILIKHGARLDASKKSPITVATEKCYEEILRILIASLLPPQLLEKYDVSQKITEKSCSQD